MPKTDHLTWDKFVHLLETRDSRDFFHSLGRGLQAAGMPWTSPAIGQGMEGENACFQVIGITTPTLS